MTKINALLIDDDKNFCKTFQTLSENSFNLTIVHSGREGLQQIKKISPEVVLLDLKLGRGLNGLEVLKRIKKSYPDLPVIIITDFADVDTAVKAMKLGAFHYTSKSPNIEALKLIIERQLEQINWKLMLYEKKKEFYKDFIAVSPIMKSILHTIDTIAKTDSTVLIEGESGTGKEVTAREIHYRSQRRDKPFTAINCSTLSPQLFESEFFGHERGAFTGAVVRKKGKLELADQGTIFLDEIGDLPIESQAKILRAIESKKFERLGGNETISIDVRIITATNRNLMKLVREKSFREDLYYRLSVINISIPPLRERPEDIPRLVQLFVQRYAEEMGKPTPEVNSNAFERLKSYHWPGNVRELKNFIEKLIAFHDTKKPITAEEICLNNNEISLKYPAHLLNMSYKEAKKWLLDDFRNVYFLRALEKNRGNITATANELGINRSSLHKMIKNLGLKEY